MVNSRERFAAAVIVITLTIGVIAGTLRQARVDQSTPGTSDKQDYGSSIHTYVMLDINSASVEQLMALPGIGPKKASAIVEWRTCNGPFRRIEDLTAVKGIGEKTLALIQAYVCTSKGDSVAARQ